MDAAGAALRTLRLAVGSGLSWPRKEGVLLPAGFRRCPAAVRPRHTWCAPGGTAALRERGWNRSAAAGLRGVGDVGTPPAQRCPLTPSGRAVGSLPPPPSFSAPPPGALLTRWVSPDVTRRMGASIFVGLRRSMLRFLFRQPPPPTTAALPPPSPLLGGAVEALGVPSEAPFPTRGRAVGGTELPWGRGGMEVEGGQTEVEALPYESGEALQRLPGGAVVAPSVPGGVGVGVGQPGLVVNGEVGGSACSGGGVGAPPSRRSPPTQPVLGLLVPAVFPSLPSGVGGRPVLRRSLMAFSVN